jgi:hypothetical protein
VWTKTSVINLSAIYQNSKYCSRWSRTRDEVILVVDSLLATRLVDTGLKSDVPDNKVGGRPIEYLYGWYDAKLQYRVSLADYYCAVVLS